MFKKSIVIWLFILQASVYAGPTIYGPTGLITIPTAESLKYKEFNMAYDYTYGPGAEHQSYFYKANIGTFRNWELGILGGENPEEGVFLNTKYYLLSDNERFPVSIAIGAENLASKDDTGVYMVASKRFKGGLTGHFGFRAVFAEEELDPSVMGGFEYYLSNSFSILADFQGKQKIYEVNAGLRYMMLRNVVLRAYAFDVTNSSENGAYYSIGISFSKFI